MHLTNAERASGDAGVYNKDKRIAGAGLSKTLLPPGSVAVIGLIILFEWFYWCFNHMPIPFNYTDADFTAINMALMQRIGLVLTVLVSICMPALFTVLVKASIYWVHTT